MRERSTMTQYELSCQRILFSCWELPIVQRCPSAHWMALHWIKFFFCILPLTVLLCWNFENMDLISKIERCKRLRNLSDSPSYKIVYRIIQSHVTNWIGALLCSLQSFLNCRSFSSAREQKCRKLREGKGGEFLLNWAWWKRVSFGR